MMGRHRKKRFYSNYSSADAEFEPPVVTESSERAAIEKAAAEKRDMQRKVEENLIGTQEMLHRHKIGDDATKERLSMWEKFRNPPVPTTQQRIATKNKEATADLRRRTEAAAKKRSGGFFSAPKSSAPKRHTFVMVERDEVQQQATAPKPTR